MSGPVMIGHLLLEKLARREQIRVPEADLIMQQQDQIAAFAASGRDQGILAYIYLFHAVMALPVIRPGDTVLDLACGPANQLAQMAQLNPDTHFIGVDASPNMLELARGTSANAGLSNVTLQPGDITRLAGFADASVDCAICTMSLHHLPDTAALAATLREIGRVLKPDGGIYLADFGRLRRTATQRFFAYDRQELQSQQFTEDFLNSMRAAFSPAEFRTALAASGRQIDYYATALAPFMMIGRSPARRTLDDSLTQQVQRAYAGLTKGQRRDFNNFTRWFKAGGLELPCPVR